MEDNQNVVQPSLLQNTQDTNTTPHDGDHTHNKQSLPYLPPSLSEESTNTQEISLMQHLMTEMQQLRYDFETKVKYDESKERLIESLHRELQVYREGLHFRILRPVLMDLISMYHDVVRLINNRPVEETSAAFEQNIKNIQLFQVTIEETLRRQGVESFHIESDMFVASKQSIVHVIETSDPSLNKRVAQRTCPGFVYEGKVLSPEMVDVYRTI